MRSSLLAVLLLLAASSYAVADDGRPGDGGEAKGPKETSPAKVAKPDESVHGGVQSKSGDYRIETVMRGRDVRLYLFDSSGKPLSTKKIEATVRVVTAKGGKVAVPMKHVAAADGRTQSYLAGTTDLDYAEDSGQKLSVSLSGLGTEGKKSASFEVGVRASDRVSYVCPMHGAARSEDPGKCPECKMSLKREVKKAVVEKKQNEAWACPMHPEVTAKTAGDCPKCGMKLKRVESGGRAEKKAAADPVYTCPMHSGVKSKTPGKCPKCSMPLKQVSPEKKSEKSGEKKGCGCCGGA